MKIYTVEFEAKAEAKFYRKLLEQICEDPRRTRARRLAQAGLGFWDSMQEEKAKRLGKFLHFFAKARRLVK